jgi:hypothetical protein
VTGLLLVGNPEPHHVGAHLLAAAGALGVSAELVDARRAHAGPRWLRALGWRLAGRRPPRLGATSAEVARRCRSARPACLLTTGLAPVSARALRAAGAAGVPRLSYLTDDPWNPEHRAPWFLDALREYDHVFTPRRGNLDDLVRHVGPRVSYLPFAWAPEAHYPDPPPAGPAAAALAADLVFVGGAEPGRARLLGQAARAGLRVALYGSRWERYPDTAALTRGQVDPAEARRATSAARIALGLVRRGNRDGHTMRSFEAAAMGACLLLEESPEHREIFGAPGEAAVYFRGAAELVERARRLLADGPERARLARAARLRVTTGGHTYRDRLAAILARVAAPAGAVPA